MIFKQREAECEVIAEKIEVEKQELQKIRRQFFITGQLQHMIIDRQIEQENKTKAAILDNIQDNNLLGNIDQVC